jgi:hypothetical protein
VSVKTTVTANDSAVDSDSPMRGILFLPTAREYPETLLDDQAFPSVEVYAVVPQFRSEDEVTFLSHRLGAAASG